MQNEKKQMGRLRFLWDLGIGGTFNVCRFTSHLTYDSELAIICPVLLGEPPVRGKGFMPTLLPLF